MRPEIVLKLNKFKPRDYQLPIAKALEQDGYKKILCIMPRRSGKDILAWNLMIRAALKTVGVYFYCLPTFRQAKLVIWDSITNTGERFIDYIPKELIAQSNSQEMKIRLVNGSLIQLIGSDTYDTSLVGTNPRMVVFSEWALSDSRAYSFVRPILKANDGIAIFLSCVGPQTLVLMNTGFSRIKNVSSCRDEYSDLNQPVWGLGGFHTAEQFYYGGVQPTLKIALESGYHIECTPIHPLWNGKEWIKSQDLSVGDLMPIEYGQDAWGPGLDISDFCSSTHKGRKKVAFSVADENFFYLLGLIHADGSYDENKVCVTNKKDQQIIDFLHSYGFKTRLDTIHHEFSCREFCDLLEYLGFKHGARNKAFPDSLLSCTKQEMGSFIQGIFDGDGCSASHPSKRGYVKFTSTCLEFVRDLQVVLLNFGIVSSIRREDKEPTKKVKVWSRIYNLEITGYFAHIFYRDIGFRLERKQRNWNNVPDSCKEESGNVYPIDAARLEDYSLPKNIVTNPTRMSRRLIRKLHTHKPHPYLQKLLDQKLFYSPIKHIDVGKSKVYDFVIPETHSFFSNGYLSHNTPRGKNHLYQLYQLASHLDDWFVYKLTVEDTKHISINDIEREIASGETSRDLALQEYWCSFEMGIEGGYYAKYLDRLRLNNQIGDVPWEPGFDVNTAWDLGFRDSTTIIFYQIIGQMVRIIDCYENSKEGLEYYVKILQSKPYVYGKHFAPHDIKVRELGTGMSRLEKARHLGLSFVVSPNIPIPDGIEAVRTALPRMCFDEKNCAPLLKALENYRQEYDHKNKIYKPRPLHDWSSHFADSMRYLCVSLHKTGRGTTPEELDARYQEAVYGNQSNLPEFFR